MIEFKKTKDRLGQNIDVIDEIFNHMYNNSMYMTINNLIEDAVYEATFEGFPKETSQQYCENNLKALIWNMLLTYANDIEYKITKKDLKEMVKNIDKTKTLNEIFESVVIKEYR